MKTQENEPVEEVQPDLGGNAPAASSEQQTQPNGRLPEADRQSTEANASDTPSPSSPDALGAETMSPETQQAADVKVIEMLKQLQSVMAERLRYDDLKEQMFSALHEELKGYKQDALAQAKKPLINDLLLLYDRVTKDAERAEGEVSKALQAVSQDIADILYRVDVEPMTDTPKRFDRTLQRAIRAEVTGDQSADMTIGKVVRRGFLWNGSVLRPEEVIVLRYESSAADSSVTG